MGPTHLSLCTTLLNAFEHYLEKHIGQGFLVGDLTWGFCWGFSDYEVLSGSYSQEMMGLVLGYYSL